MPATSDAKANLAAAVEPAIRPGLPWRIVSVTPMSGYRLKIRFVDGLEGEVHMRELLTSGRTGVFDPLRDERFFNKATVHWGAVTWPGELDLAPDAMYDDIKSNGVCVIGPFKD